MVLRDVGDFMAQHGSQFRFTLRRQQQPAVYANEAARHGKGIDVVIIEHKKFETQSRLRTVFNQPVAEPIEIIIDFGIVQILFPGANLHHALLADLAFLQRGEHGLRSIAQVGQAIAHGAGRKAQQQHDGKLSHGHYDSCFHL